MNVARRVEQENLKFEILRGFEGIKAESHSK